MPDASPRKSQLHLDMVAAFGGCLIIEGQCAADDIVSAVSVRPPNSQAERMVSIVKASHRLHRASDDDEDVNGFIIKAPCENIADLQPAQRNLCWTVQARSGLRTHLTGRARTMLLPDGKGDSLARWAIMRAIEAGLFDVGLSALANFDLVLADRLPMVGAHVESVVRSGEMLLIELWAPNAGKRNLIAFTPDLQDVAAGIDLLHSSRPDLNETIEKSGCIVETDQHGVIISLRNGLANDKHTMLAEIKDNKIIALQRIENASLAPSQALFEKVVKLVGNGRLPTPEAAERFIRPMTSRARPEIECSLHLISDLDVSPEISVIVTLAGTASFVQQFVAMQLKAPRSLEWIIVCDDPSLHGRVLAQLQSRSELLRGRTLLVCNEESYGAGPARMTGAKLAQGRMLMFMSADVWLDDFSVFETAVAAIDSGAYGAIGFRLSYMDGTILHDGLRFKKSSEAHDLLLPDFPGEGLPPKDQDDGILTVPAVSGALFLISKAIFDDVDGFDHEYVVDGYEDIDLCLKVRKLARKNIGLVRKDGCRQLQSPEAPGIGELSLAGAIAYLNCLTFNKKWRVSIEQELTSGEWSR